MNSTPSSEATPSVDEHYVPVPALSTQTIAIDDELVLLNEASQAVVRLDRIGALVYQCFDAASSLGDIAADAAPVFGLPVEVITADIIRLANDLLRTTILAGSGPAPVGAEREAFVPPFVLTNPPSP